MSSFDDMFYPRFTPMTWYEREMLQRAEAERLSTFWRDYNPPMFSTAKPKPTWLDQAKDISTGDRRKAYGHPLPNFLRAAIAFTPILGHPITPLQVAELQVAWKVVRDVNSFKEDNWIDTIGYSNTVQMMDDRMKELGFAKGVDHFRGFSGPSMLYEMYDALDKHEKRFPQNK